MDIVRREALALGGAALLFPPPAGAMQAPGAALDTVAKTRGLRFGTAMGIRNGSFDDPNYRALVLKECGVLVPENELKWGWLRPNAATFDFSGADRILAFAELHKVDFRGHNLLWHHPDWLPHWLTTYDFGASPAGTAAALVRTHIDTVCRRYGRRIGSYDVVNEAVVPETGVLRETVLSRAMGSPEAVLDLAFHTARAAAPHAQLVYNDYMGWDAGDTAHRDGVLKLLQGFRARNVPIDALGVQSHISPPADGAIPEVREWRRFLDAVTGLGLDLVVTEFDVDDRKLPAETGARDALVAAYGGAYLDLMLGYPQLHTVMTWGLCDRYSWLQHRELRPDRLAKRPCPYDAGYQPKPLRRSIAAALGRAAVRPA